MEYNYFSVIKVHFIYSSGNFLFFIELSLFIFIDYENNKPTILFIVNFIVWNKFKCTPIRLKLLEKYKQYVLNGFLQF